MLSKKLLIVFLLIVALWLTGVAGYMFIEKWRLLDSIYMTAISLTTVGFKEVRPLSDYGRVFTIVLITLGVGLFFYAAGTLAEAIIEGHIRGLIGRKRMEKRIGKLSDHYIVCGYGRLGRVICHELQMRRFPVVVIDNRETAIKVAGQNGLLYLKGDATLDETLVKAGIKRAKGLITVLGTDAANVYITISARSLNPRFTIVARAEDENAEKKMFRVGATKVISPYKIGATRMALAVLKPTLTDFLDLASHSVGFDLDIEQIEIMPGSELAGKALKDVSLREKTGVTVVAIKKKGGRLSLQLSPDEPLSPGDTIIALGSKSGVQKVFKMAGHNVTLD